MLTDSASSRFDGGGRGSILLCSQHGDRQTAPAKRLSQPAHRTVQTVGGATQRRFCLHTVGADAVGWWGS